MEPIPVTVALPELCKDNPLSSFRESKVVLAFDAIEQKWYFATLTAYSSGDKYWHTDDRHDEGTLYRVTHWLSAPDNPTKKRQRAADFRRQVNGA